jgi:putative acetyltransferase
MNDRLTIRPLERDDVPAMLAIIREARAEFGLAARVPTLLESADLTLYETYQGRRALHLIASLDGEVVGGAGIAPLTGADALTCELQRMYLRREIRGLGIGARLLGECVDAARRFWYARCYVETIAEMKPALAFYARHGFVSLPGPIGNAGHPHNDRWLLRELRGMGPRASAERGGPSVRRPVAL